MFDRPVFKRALVAGLPIADQAPAPPQAQFPRTP